MVSIPLLAAASSSAETDICGVVESALPFNLPSSSRLECNAYSFIAHLITGR